MTIRKRFLKSVLTTTTLAAALVGASESAFAAAQNTLGAGISTAAHLIAGAGGNAGGGNNNAGSWGITTAPGAILDFIAGTAVPGGLIVAHTGAVINVTFVGASSIGSIAANGGIVANPTFNAALNIGAGAAFTLTGQGNAAVLAADIGGPANTYSGLGPITFADNTSVLDIAPGAAGALTFNGPINGAGTMNITNAGNTTTFNGVIGGTTPLTLIAVNGTSSSTFTANVSATNITTAVAVSTMTIGSVAGMTVATTGANGIALGAGSFLKTVANGNATISGNVSGAGLVQLNNGSTLTFTGPSTIAQDISAVNAGNASLVLNGVITTGTIGNAAAVLTTTTGTGLVTFGGAVNTSALVIGAGGATTASNVTVGATGITGTGKLAFTAAKNLTIAGTAGSVIVGANNTIQAPSAAALIINSNFAGTNTFAGTLETTDATSNLTFANGAANTLIFTKDIGATGAANTFATVLLTGVNDKIALGTTTAGSTLWATTVNLGNAGSAIRLNADSGVSGAIAAAAAGTIVVLGENTGSAKLVSPVAAPLGAMTFDATAVNGGFTFDVDTTTAFTGVTQIGVLNYNNTSTGDNSGIVLDMTNVAAAYPNTALISQAVIVAGGASGSITFANNTNKAPVTLTANGGNLGAVASYLNTIDATGAKLTLTGAAANATIMTNVLKADSVNFQSGNTLTLGVYNTTGGTPNTTTLDAAAPTTYTVSAANVYTIAANSVISTATSPTTLQYAANGALTLSDAVDFYGTVTQNQGAAATGTLTLAGNNKVSVSSIGTKTSTLAGITITGGAGKVAQLLSLTSGTVANVYVPAVTFANGASATTTLNLGVNVHGNVTNTSVAIAGVVNLQDGANIDGSLGSGVAGALTSLTEVQVNTTGIVNVGNGTVNGQTYTASKTTFQKDGTLVLSQNVSGGVVLGTVSTTVNHAGTIVTNQSIVTAANIGADQFSLKGFVLANAAANNTSLTVNNDLYIDSITTDANAKGTVTFAGASNSGATSIGTDAVRPASVTINAPTTLKNIYATSIDINGGSLAALRFDASNATTGTILNATVAEVLDGGYIGLVTGTGTVNVDGTATLAGNITGNVNLDGAAKTVVTFGGSKITGNVTHDATTLNLNNNMEITGTYAGTNADIVTNGKTLALDGAATFDGKTTVTYVYAANAPIIIANSTVSANAVGDTITFTRALGSALPVSGSTIAPFGSANNTAVVLGPKANVTANSIVTNDSSKFFSTTYNATTGLITYTGVATAAKLLSSAGLANANQLDAANKIAAFINSSTTRNDTTLEAFVSQLEVMTSTGKASEAMARVTDASAPAAVSDVSAGALAGLSHQAESRMSSTTYAAASGVAAGDAAEKFGVWAEVTGGTAEQKLRKNVSGFQARSFGTVVGVDTMLSDSSSLGVVAGNSLSTVKFKDTKSGDKLRADSWLFGAYGNYEFSNNYFVQANAAVAQTTAKAKSGRITPAGRVTAAGKYDMMSYVAEVRGGYKYQFENSVVAPTVGLRYNYFGDTSYTETGAGVQNLKVNTKSTSGLSALAGVKLGTTVDMNGSAIMPEVHMNLDYALSSSAPKARYNLDGSSVSFNYKGAKSSKFGYNFGASVMAQNDNVEYGVGYDANIADKYLGHQGTVKVKVKF